MAWGEVHQNAGNALSQKTKGKKIVLPVVKLRHAKVVVSRQYPRKKTLSGMHSSRYRIVFLLFFPPVKTLPKMRSIGGVLFVAVVPDSVAVIVCKSSASGRVGT